MRFISFLLALCFSLNVLASSGTIGEFERALDDYHYNLMVEWDQKDQQFFDSRTQEFFSKLEKFIQEDGLSKEQIITILKNKITDPMVIDALNLKLSTLNKATTLEDLMKMIQDHSSSIYAQGASWSGGVLIPAAIVLLVAAAVGYSIWFNANHTCVETKSVYMCNSYNNCYYGPDITYGGYYCYGGVGLYTVCGNTDVCTQYTKK